MKNKRRSPPAFAGTKTAPAQSRVTALASVAKVVNEEDLQGVSEPAVEIDGVAAAAQILAVLDHLRLMASSNLDHETDLAARATLNDLLDALSGAKTEVNSEEIQNHTLSLQAAEDEFKPGIEELTRLKAELASMTEMVTDAAKIITGIDDALQGIQSLLKTFP